MIADNLKEYLAEKLFYKKGVDLFVNHIDAKVTEAVVIYDTGSVNIENYINLDQFTVQVMVISKKHDNAKKKSIDIYNLLNRKQGLVMDGKNCKFVKAMQTPYSIGYDGVWKVVANYVIMSCL